MDYNKSTNLLLDRIEEELRRIDSIEDEDSRRRAIDDLAVLYKLKIEEEKAIFETDDNSKKWYLEKERIKNEERDLELREKQLKEQKTDRLANLGVQIGLSLLSIVAYDIWNRRGLKFEEHGTITSPMTRNLLLKMLPKLKN